MIIIGYQGIGKSTVSATNISCIDLDSSLFWYDINVDGHSSTVRDSSWYIPYCKIATALSSQGYDVFVSSHAEVRQELQNSEEDVVAVVPSIALRDDWVERLRTRYESTKLSKDLKALLNATVQYDINIREIKQDCAHVIEITRMNYDLGRLIHEYHKQLGR